MARKERINIPGAVYHVILRGNDRRDIFADNKDRYRLYSILDHTFQRFEFKIHAFCLMSNHLHFEIQVSDTPLPTIMQCIAQRYTQWFNWRHHKSGHLFQGRYKAIMVDVDDYLMELAAYIHLNPVRARLTAHPEKYRWSSHRAYLGKESLPWLETGFILSTFSSNPGKARSMFRDFVNGHIGQERSKEFHGEKNPDNRILGDEYFVLGVLEETEDTHLVKPDLQSVLRAIETVFGPEAHQLLTTGQRDRRSFEARALAAWSTINLSNATLTELGKYCGRDESTMSCAIRRIEVQKSSSPHILAKMEQLRQILTPERSQRRTKTILDENKENDDD
jgi:putative transposase